MSYIDTMRAREIFTKTSICEMAMPRKMAIDTVRGLQRQINLHLLKLLACQADDDLRNHWKKELRGWFGELADIVLKPKNKPLPAKDIYELLYDYPFGGVEIQNVTNILSRFVKYDGYVRNEVEVTQISKRFRDFHKTMCKRLAKNNDGADLVDGL